MSLRLVVVDDDALVRDGLRALLSAEPDLEVVAEAADGVAAVAVVAEHDPDVVLMDVRMPGLDGIAATRAITALHPERPRVLVVTTFPHDQYLLGALAAGASGVVLKRAGAEELVAAVRAVAQGGSLVLPVRTRGLLAALPVADDAVRAAVERLTPREREVLVLMARGLSNAEIAADLTLGVETVKTHVGSVLAKLGARDRTQAVVTAYRAGAVQVAGPL